MGVGGERHAPAALHLGKIRYPLYRRLGGPQGRSGRVRKISPSPGFDPRTAQPVVSRYTDWAIPAPLNSEVLEELYCKFLTVSECYQKIKSLCRKVSMSLVTILH